MRSETVIQSEVIESLGDYISMVCDTATSHALVDTFLNVSMLTLYRGQEQDWLLLPKIARGDFLTKEVLKKENRVISEFRRLAHSFVDIDINNDWNLLALAQHHRLPTRLLDWTENPLVALWFALIKDTTDTKYRVVWRLVLEETEVIDTNNSGPFDLNKTVVFKPNHISRRIAAQTGWFTAHYYKKAENKFIPLNNNKLYTSKLRKFCFPNTLQFREDTLLKLDKLGINSFTLFPDLDGLSGYLEWKNQVSKAANRKGKKSKRLKVTHRLVKKVSP